MWSPWKCEISTMSTAFGSMPAAFMLALIWPAAPLVCLEGAKPVAGVDHDQLGAGVHHHRIERNGDLALRHVGGFGRRERSSFFLLTTNVSGIGKVRAPSATWVTS